MHDQLTCLPTADGHQVPRGEAIPPGAIRPPTTPQRLLWLDTSEGASGDMLLGALLDAGADAGSVAAVLELVAPGRLRLQRRRLRRGPFTACKVDVLADEPHPPARHLGDVLELLDGSAIPETTRETATLAFTLLAEAEAKVHGVTVEEVHFHEVGALDSIGDIVAVCEAVRTLGVIRATSSVTALGAGTVHTQHGVMSVPPPAVLELAAGWQVEAGGPAEVGELCTPTGMALIRALCSEVTDLPRMHVDATGVGAGSRERTDRAGVLRAVLGTPLRDVHLMDEVQEISANVDDLDPRLWPGVLETLLGAGALDVWLVPIVMKKGRPAHTLCVLAHPRNIDDIARAMLKHTSTLGVRISPPQQRRLLRRDFRRIRVEGLDVQVKIAGDGHLIQHATIEFKDVERLAELTGWSQRVALATAQRQAQRAGLQPGGHWPEGIDHD